MIGDLTDNVYMTRVCKTCGEEKPSAKFRLVKGKDKECREGTCKKCRSARSVQAMRDRKKNDPEIQKRISEQRKERYHSDPEFRRRLIKIVAKNQSTEHGKAKQDERRKAWSKSAKGRAWRKKWEKESAAGKRARKTVMKNWLSTPAGKEFKARHGAKRRGAAQSSGSPVTAAEWNSLLGQYDYRCAYCGEKFSEINPATRDHIVPVSKGGCHAIENLRPACRGCNSKKNNRDLTPIIQIRKATA
jgi:5-methylcytosine-specific restriction endonuclease McrA